MKYLIYNYLLSIVYFASNSSEENVKETKVLVLGAGMSGIMAAKTLHENGETDFMILEGSDRVGGRTRSTLFQGVSIGLGCQWIQEVTTQNQVFYYLIHDSILSNTTVHYDEIRNGWTVRDDTGHLITDTADTKCYELDSIAYQFNAVYKPSHDVPGDWSLRTAWKNLGWNPTSKIQKLCDWQKGDYKHGRPPEEVSAKYESSIRTSRRHKDLKYFIQMDDEGEYGFDHMHNHLLREFMSDNDVRLKLNTIVRNIEYSDEGVKVTTENGDIYHAEYAIVTFSVGVLKDSYVTFTPPLPDLKQESIRKIQVGHFVQFVMYFHTPFWDINSEFIARSSDSHPADYYPWFLNLKPGQSKLSIPAPEEIFLQATVTGKEALRLDGLRNDDIAKEVMVVLREMYGESIPEPNDTVVHRWSTDPLYMGSVANWPPGFTSKDQETLCAPLHNALFFAGDACSKQRFGFLHGAYVSGVETAEKLLNCHLVQRDCSVNAGTALTGLVTWRCPALLVFILHIILIFV